MPPRLPFPERPGWCGGQRACARTAAVLLSALLGKKRGGSHEEAAGEGQGEGQQGLANHRMELLISELPGKRLKQQTHNRACPLPGDTQREGLGEYGEERGVSTWTHESLGGTELALDLSKPYLRSGLSSRWESALPEMEQKGLNTGSGVGGWDNECASVIKPLIVNYPPDIA